MKIEKYITPAVIGSDKKQLYNVAKQPYNVAESTNRKFSTIRTWCKLKCLSSVAVRLRL